MSTAAWDGCENNPRAPPENTALIDHQVWGGPRSDRLLGSDRNILQFADSDAQKLRLAIHWVAERSLEHALVLADLALDGRLRG